MAGRSVVESGLKVERTDLRELRVFRLGVSTKFGCSVFLTFHLLVWKNDRCCVWDWRVFWTSCQLTKIGDTYFGVFPVCDRVNVMVRKLDRHRKLVPAAVECTGPKFPRLNWHH